jgi:hypothetical protein
VQSIHSQQCGNSKHNCKALHVKKVSLKMGREASEKVNFQVTPSRTSETGPTHLHLACQHGRLMPVQEVSQAPADLELALQRQGRAPAAH